MANLVFRPIEITDLHQVQEQVYATTCRNCDLSFMNLVSWSARFDTAIADFHGWLLIRFRVDGHLAYLPPLGEGDGCQVFQAMMQDAASLGEPFCMMGVCEPTLSWINQSLPGIFETTFDRAYADYIYQKSTLGSLAGKKLQSKRNHVNRFVHLYPDYSFQPLSKTDIGDCLALVHRWHDQKSNTETAGYLTADDEKAAMDYVFRHWEELGGLGGVLRVNGQLIAFTYGAPINYDTFDVCVEKADVAYEGAFAMINREFARWLPSQYVYLNREEDLGIDGLRKAKLSYHPDFILNKYTLTVK